MMLVHLSSLIPTVEEEESIVGCVCAAARGQPPGRDERSARYLVSSSERVSDKSPLLSVLSFIHAQQ